MVLEFFFQPDELRFQVRFQDGRLIARSLALPAGKICRVEMLEIEDGLLSLSLE
jgi:hypothetical protein